MHLEKLEVQGGPVKDKLTSVLSFFPKDQPYIIAHYIDGEATVQKDEINCLHERQTKM